MGFITDRQTLEDLNLLGKYKSNSIFKLYNRTCTKSGEAVLEQWFRTPQTDAAEINRRSEIFRFFEKAEVSFPVPKDLLNTVDHYAGGHAHRNRGIAFLNICRQRMMHNLTGNKEFPQICGGVEDTIRLLRLLADFHRQLSALPDNGAYAAVLEEMDACLHSGQLAHLPETSGLSFIQTIRYDYLFRSLCRDKLKRLLEILAQADVYISVADLAKAKEWGYAEACSPELGSYIEVTDLVHPRLVNGVSNSLRLDSNQNVIFLTGANMAGKSTLMKAFSIAFYLAHIGFPIPAKQMKFTVHDGIYTSINLPDNIRLGYSHFYAEVARVKQVAEEVSRKKKLLVIFDELFKGTNVKDAYDATLAVTEAFAVYRDCHFIISTHILEVGEALKAKAANIQFWYIPTIVQGSKATYTYQLQAGITHDRHGMMIIRNEHILDIIKERQHT